jgi:rhomboid family GlyGly-CTERM serine protease
MNARSRKQRIAEPTASSPWWKSSPWTLGLCALMVAINLALLQPGSEPSGPWIDALEFNRQAVLHGQLWRLVTGSLVHWSREHFLLDVGAFLIVGLLYERHLRRSYPWILLASGVAVGCGVLWFRPDMTVYRGLSGVDSGQFAAAILVECGLAAREPRRWIWVLPVAGVFAFKILYECLSGQLLFGTDSLGAIGVPTPVAPAAREGCGGGLLWRNRPPLSYHPCLAKRHQVTSMRKSSRVPPADSSEAIIRR